MVLRTATFVLASTAVASAQPVTHPEPVPCAVRVASAPDDVRAVIEAWVAAEPRCLRELDVRVTPFANGLHLSARDDAGQVRERIVPDAQSAAVLVVSWMADDSIGEPPPEVEAAAEPAPVAPSIVLAPIGVDDELPLVLERHERQLVRHWLTLGMIGSHDGGGLRAQADLLVHGRWTLGVAASVQGDNTDEHHNGDRMPTGGTANANAFVARTHSIGRFVVRTQLGLGADVRATTTMTDTMERSIAPALNAAVLGQLRIGERWGLVGGPVLDVPFDHDNHPSIAAFFGVQYGR